MERHELLDMMAQLKLAGMRAAYDDILADGLKRRHPVQQIIGTLLKAEIADKKARSIKYQMTSAKLPTAKELADFDFAASPVNEPLIQELATGGFLEGQRSSAVAAGAVPQRESEGVEDSEVSGADTDAEGPSEPHRREFLTTDEAAVVLGVSPKMLSRFRAAGTGPAYHRFGYKVAYAYTDLLSWALSRRQTTRESE